MGWVCFSFVSVPYDETGGRRGGVVGGDNGVEVCRGGKKKLKQVSWIAKSRRQLMYTHLSQIDILYTAGQAPRNEARKTSGIQEKQGRTHSVLKTPVPPPIAMSMSIGGAMPVR